MSKNKIKYFFFLKGKGTTKSDEDNERVVLAILEASKSDAKKTANYYK